MEQSPSLSLKRQFYKEGREGTKTRIRETKTNKKNGITLELTTTMTNYRHTRQTKTQAE